MDTIIDYQEGIKLSDIQRAVSVGHPISNELAQALINKIAQLSH